MIEDITEVKRAEHAQRFLAQAGALLASSLDYEQTLDQIARLAVPRLADWCNVTMPGGDVCGASRSCTSIPRSSSSPASTRSATRPRLDAPGAEHVLRAGVAA